MIIYDAHLGVDGEPCGSRVVAAQESPLRQQLARDRLVILIAARKAESSAALALHSTRSYVIGFNRAAAVDRRTPSHLAMAVDEARCHQLLIASLHPIALDKP